MTDAELLKDLRRVAEVLNSSTVSRPNYPKQGKFGITTFNSRFGGWNKALVAAGLVTSHEINISDERLFENILILWQHYGRAAASDRTILITFNDIAGAIQSPLRWLAGFTSWVRQLLERI